MSERDLSAYGKGTGGYGSRDLVQKYLENGSLPEIHADIEQAIKLHHPALRMTAMDLGACTGLLALRLRRMGFPCVLGIEAFEPDVRLFKDVIKPTMQGVNVAHMALDVDDAASLQAMTNALHTYEVKTVVMRRVLPEVLAKFGDRVAGSRPSDAKKAVLIPGGGARLAQAFLDAGVRYLVIEGRVSSARSVHPLATLDLEVRQMQPRFREIGRYRNVSVMEASA